MQEDTMLYDSLKIRPLPKWLTDQKEGLTTYKPPEFVMKEDNSLTVAFALTGLFVILVITVLTIFIIREKKKD